MHPFWPIPKIIAAWGLYNGPLTVHGFILTLSLGPPLVAWVAAIESLLRNRRWLKNAHSTQGLVVDSEVVRSGKNGDEPFYHAVIEFYAADGKAYRVRASASTPEPPDLTNPVQFPVLYLANNPNNARLDTEDERPHPLTLFTVALILSVAGGIFFYCSYQP